MRNGVGVILPSKVFCSFCSSHIESCIHILRDCTFARQFWSWVLPQVIAGNELSKDWSIWLDEHIRSHRHSVVFGVGVWLLWRARNKRIFEQGTETFMDVAHRCDYWAALIRSSWKTERSPALLLRLLLFFRSQLCRESYSHLVRLNSSETNLGRNCSLNPTNAGYILSWYNVFVLVLRGFHIHHHSSIDVLGKVVLTVIA
ncbi:hypothetical protein LINGRAHAP2_LOCUS30526 [Linum grandiflorum]